jgi:hypothetical protein
MGTGSRTVAFERSYGAIVNFARVEEIADAVLYEGYMLYPYRPSAVKNQQRWNFGVVCPESYCASQPGSESSCMQTQCLLRTTPASHVAVKIRFLQIVQRLIGQYREQDPDLATGSTNGLEFLDRLVLDGHVHRPLQEAAERAVICEAFDATSLDLRTIEFSFPPEDLIEDLRDARGNLVGAVVRQRNTLEGTIRIAAEPCRDDVVRLTVRIDNRSKFAAAAVGPSPGRDAALLQSLVSTHIILGVQDGEFLSSLDPPLGYEDVAAACENIGAWPVLVGDNAATMLASPIILYDNPQIAPESAGNLFDGTEIDEILSLRILTLTEEEKTEIRQSDDRARQLLERTENIPNEQFLKLHGVLRGLNPLREGSE